MGGWRVTVMGAIEGCKRTWFGEPYCPLQVIPDIREDSQALTKLYLFPLIVDLYV